MCMISDEAMVETRFEFISAFMVLATEFPMNGRGEQELQLFLNMIKQSGIPFH